MSNPTATSSPSIVASMLPDSQAVIVSLLNDKAMPHPLDVDNPQTHLPVLLEHDDADLDAQHNAVLTQHRISNTWGRATGCGKDFEETERVWVDRDNLQSPKIVSLNPGRSGWGTSSEPSVFRWRTSGESSHHHIIFYVRRDLFRIIAPLGEPRVTPLTGADSKKWAQTQLIRCLPEVQHARIPGPNFTLAEVRDRKSVVKANVSAAQQDIALNLSLMDKFWVKQEPLHATLRALDNERSALIKSNERLEVDLKEYAEVVDDLEDLETLRLAYTPSE
ncbi:hypothetical protein AAF712_012192 [Marasmius tenuissimus]|uniref:Uncharacterized protein n=1 Tax=Marasmius tenuissimus TaxID=585030 RepID=A0ABR2ZH62_9AGAR